LLRGTWQRHNKYGCERRAKEVLEALEHLSPLRTENLSQTGERGFARNSCRAPLVLALRSE
jgi:hypothetical protein